MRKPIKNCSAKEIYENYDLNKDNKNYMAIYQVVSVSKSKVELETKDEYILWYALDKGLKSSLDLFDTLVGETLISLSDNSLN